MHLAQYLLPTVKGFLQKILNFKIIIKNNYLKTFKFAVYPRKELMIIYFILSYGKRETVFYFGSVIFHIHNIEKLNKNIFFCYNYLFYMTLFIFSVYISLSVSFFSLYFPLDVSVSVSFFVSSSINLFVSVSASFSVCLCLSHGIAKLQNSIFFLF
jgi:hypothetical protein